MSYYICGVCDQPITGDDIEDRHSTASGEDCHAQCCETCFPQIQRNFDRMLDNFFNLVVSYQKGDL